MLARKQFAILLLLSSYTPCDALHASRTPNEACVQHRRKTWSVRSSIITNKVIAGGSSRALAQILLYPSDALRTLAQTRDGRTLANVGNRALLRGSIQTSLFALFTGAIQFGIFGMVQPRHGSFIASAFGAAGSCLISIPQEVIKQRLVTGVYGSFREAVSNIWKADGPLGFYRAWKPTVSRNVPFVIVAFTSRDVLRNHFERIKDSGINTMDDFIIGISSALLAVLATQPVDVIKTRMMTQAASLAIPYTSAIDCGLSVLKIEGWRKLYSGIGPRIVYMCGLWGITFAVEPKIREILESSSSFSRPDLLN